MAMNSIKSGRVTIEIKLINPDRILNIFWSRNINIYKINKKNISSIRMDIDYINYDEVCEVIKALDERPEEQTYRGFVEFKCDTCSKVYKHGKVIYSRLAKFHLCYECYKNAKGNVELKRGNKHVFINTPM